MKKVLLLFLTLIMVSCQNKVKVSDLHYEFINGLYTITVDGKPFDGVAWGEDGESFSVKVINGMLWECVYYDTDGVMYWKYDGEDENFYDKNGKIISEERFSKQYHDAYERWDGGSEYEEFIGLLGMEMLTNFEDSDDDYTDFGESDEDYTDIEEDSL
jgi:hypothetical protein